MENWKGYRVWGIFLFNEVDYDSNHDFKDMRINWKKKVGGVCEKVDMMDIIVAINLENNFTQLVMEKFKKAVEIDGPKYTRYCSINDICLVVLEVKQ
jgi:hypothetical protein